MIDGQPCWAGLKVFSVPVETEIALGGSVFRVSAFGCLDRPAVSFFALREAYSKLAPKKGTFSF